MSQLVLELVAFSFPVSGQYDGDYAYIVVLLINVYLLITVSLELQHALFFSVSHFVHIPRIILRNKRCPNCVNYMRFQLQEIHCTEAEVLDLNQTSRRTVIQNWLQE